MKEATGELNMTVITVIAIAAIGVFLWAFLPNIISSIKGTWEEGTCPEGQHATFDVNGKKNGCVANS